MRVLTEKQHVQTSSSSKELKFEIDQMHPEVMIKILSDMYPNVRRTVTTEYVQNALDSHMAAGCPDRPIQVTLPTPLNPVYTVRDFGVGMTADDINNTLRFVFRSTKAASDDQIGGFGLGKLVFGPYSGIMHLLLYSGSECSHYIVRLKNGDAGITEVSVTPSTAERGVEVRIPVFEEDCEYFEEQCRSVYALMPTRPQIMGRPDFWDDTELALDEGLFLRGRGDTKTLVFKNTIPHNGKLPVVLIGGIPFPIKSDILLPLLRKDAMARYFDAQAMGIIETMLQLPVVLSAKPGDLEVVPSRDNIKYNQQSVFWVGQKLLEIGEDIKDYIKESLETVKTFPEAWRLIRNTMTCGSGALKGIYGLTRWGPSQVPIVGPEGGFNALFKEAFESGSGYYSSLMFGTRRTNVSIDYRTENTGEGQLTTQNLQSYFGNYTNSKLIQHIISWLNGSVERVSTVCTAGRYSWRKTDGTKRVMAKDVRAKMLPLLVAMHSTLKTEEPWVVVVVDLDSCGMAKSTRCIEFEDNCIPEMNHLRLYTRGKSAKDLQEFLKSIGFETPEGVFIDVNDLESPPAATRSSSSSSTGKSGPGHIAANSLFLLDMDGGQSPSDSFNPTFWKTLTNSSLQELVNDKDTQVYYTLVSSCKPCISVDEAARMKVLHVTVEGSGKKASVRESQQFASTFLHSPTGFNQLVDYAHKTAVASTDKRIVVVGIKSKKLPDGLRSVFSLVDSIVNEHVEHIAAFLGRTDLLDKTGCLRAQTKTILERYVRELEQTGRYATKQTSSLRGMFVAFKRLVANFRIGYSESDNRLMTTALESAYQLLFVRRFKPRDQHSSLAWQNGQGRGFLRESAAETCEKIRPNLDVGCNYARVFNTKHLLEGLLEIDRMRDGQTHDRVKETDAYSTKDLCVSVNAYSLGLDNLITAPGAWLDVYNSSAVDASDYAALLDAYLDFMRDVWKTTVNLIGLRPNQYYKTGQSLVELLHGSQPLFISIVTEWDKAHEGLEDKEEARLIVIYRVLQLLVLNCCDAAAPVVSEKDTDGDGDFGPYKPSSVYKNMVYAMGRSEHQRPAYLLRNCTSADPRSLMGLWCSLVSSVIHENLYRASTILPQFATNDEQSLLEAMSLFTPSDKVFERVAQKD